jgi:IMP cyclohydrolase
MDRVIQKKLKILPFANKYVNHNILRVTQKILVVQNGNIRIDPQKILYNATFFLLRAASEN